VSSGFKAFQDKRNKQKSKTEQGNLTEKIIDSDDKDIKGLVKQIVSKGYTISNGEVKEAPKSSRMNSWLNESGKTNVHAQKWSQIPQNREERS
jgi:ribulose bisphosphate carboxylase small subunit